MEKGPDRTNLSAPTGYITPEAVYEIAKIKQMDQAMQYLPLESICRSVIGTAKTLGVVCREAPDEEATWRKKIY